MTADRARGATRDTTSRQALPGCRAIAIAGVLLAVGFPVRGADAGLGESELRQVASVLEHRCYPCHSHAEGLMEAGLTLDSASGWLQGGDSGPAVVPGKPDESRLVRAISYGDEELQMPPEEKLPEEEIALLVRWVAAGAIDPSPGLASQQTSTDWWSLHPLARPPIPGGSGANPIDAFVDDALAAKELPKAPPADAATLIRRLYYDLVGLPPTPEQVAAFVSDPSPEAYERLVDRLLADPRYGERWGRHWLDVARYADTHGNDHDFARPNAWPYRDYVIASLNDDKPYPRFVAEQVAGDALFPGDPQAIVALGFLAAGPWDHTLMVTVREDTTDHRMGINLDRDEMVSGVMAAFQGLTVHCARCHNHKFDPISQREYYGLQAVFAGVERADRPYFSDEAVEGRRRELVARRDALSRRDPAALAELDTPEAQSRLAEIEAKIADRDCGWNVLHVLDVRSEGESATSFTQQGDGSWLVEGVRPARDTFLITATTRLRNVAALRLEALADARLPGGGPGRYETGNFHLTELRVSAGPTDGSAEPVPLKVARAASDHDEPGNGVEHAIDGKSDTLWGVHPVYGRSHEGVFEFEQPVSFPSGTRFVIHLEHHGAEGHQIGRFRLSACSDALPAEYRRPLPSVAAPGSVTASEDRRQRALVWLAQDLSAEVERDLAALPPSTVRYVYAATRDFKPEGSFKPSPTIRPIHLLTRGDINRPGEPVAPAALSCLPDLPGDLAVSHPDDEAERRAAFARWLTDPRNVLTWRCAVNRVWHYHFGRGICDTPNDLGRMGGAPSHPELLDWLAVWFRDDAQGSLKALHRLIVTSDTYRRSSINLSAAAAADAENRLLWRANRRRLDAEQFRDSLLQLSGRLDSKMGGPPAVEFLDRGAATFAPADGSPPFVDYDNFDPGDTAHRRAVYRFLFRTVPDPLMDALDAPDGGAATHVRATSAGPVQALALLNDPTVLRECRHLAARIESSVHEPETQVAAAFRLVLLRDPGPTELTAMAAYARRHGLANACQVLVNSSEFLYVD